MKKILAIDDEQDILNLINDIFKNDFEVYTAKSAREALMVLDKNPIDLIILDIMMPQMDGWDFLWIMKGSENFREIPVIVLTARVDAEDKLIGLREGVKDYIVKPFLPDELVKRVNDILRKEEKSEK
ncbi:MAG TPA: response regulator [Candidatus Hydrothermia bacterium]|nr:response regulator [Candidatus Hydrothermae bacterium]MDD3649279.1 response regulator [Candidatus Hydrothermia bacterium]MDD5573138.1 response regulator [Candidatus Hydrothermia bacterium]HOK22694.1 response regulator [Candidatus Hydrothermia bacterium]HOL23403.1 response regulator [Candidatus Hydrothermia bacterium]